MHKKVLLGLIILLTTAITCRVLWSLANPRPVPLPVVGMTEDELLQGPIAVGTPGELEHHYATDCITYFVRDEFGRGAGVTVDFDKDRRVTKWKVIALELNWRGWIFEWTGH
jgi:hypothetical protein